MKKLCGFTLVELLVVLIIIGVLAAIAFPSYMESIRKSNRAEAKVSLTDVDQRLQRCFSVYGKYNDASCVVYSDASGAGIASKDRGFYLVKITAATSTATYYELKATAVLAPQTQDNVSVDCTNMTLDSKGAKGPAGCW